MRGALDSAGRLVAYDYNARSCDYNHVGYNEPDTVLIAQLMGSRRARPAAGSAAMPSEMYGIPNRRMEGHVVSLPLVWETPLRTGNLRDPNGPQSTFAAESFIDELAAAAGADPLSFRLNLLTSATADDSGFRRARSIAVLKAAAEAYGWDSRQSPRPAIKGDVLTGRGIAYSFRGETIVAQIAEVEVNRKTGHVWAKRIVCAHDCGLVVNPGAVRNQIEGGVIQSMSRALKEEVKFDHSRVTTLDWASYPIIKFEEIPDEIDIVLIDRPELPPMRVGEPASETVWPGVANAIYDAIGVRLRQLPMTPDRVLAGLSKA
jgi:CO/xanthine dehydrogenase Mo-binding subunit